MATETIIDVLPEATFTTAGALILSEAERRLLAKTTTSALIAPWLNAVEGGGLANAKDGVLLTPTSGTAKPTRVARGGPDSAPYYLAGESDPVGGLHSPDGVVNMSGDWTIAFCGKASNNGAGALIGIEGANGNATGICLTNADQLKIIKYSNTGPTGTVMSTATAATADWHVVVLSWDLSTTTISIWIDGVFVKDQVIALAFSADNLTLFTAYDPSASPALSADADTSKLAAAWMLDEYVGGSDETVLNLLHDAMTDRFPSLMP